MRMNKEQKEFIKGCVRNFLDTKKGKPHSAAEMAKWASMALSKESEQKVRVSKSAIVDAVNELRDEGYLISRDPKNRGYRCLCGKRNATPDILGIAESVMHEKGRVAASIHNNLVKPGVTIQQTVISNVQLVDAARLINELSRSNCVLDDAVGRLRALDQTEYRLVAVQPKQLNA